jgi:hypothetical protein
VLGIAKDNKRTQYLPDISKKEIVHALETANNISHSHLYSITGKATQIEEY